ncbi:MAG: hypothetical protein IPG75_19725 [Gemmatimonadetes bacterium]|nr:hypothetical protein [Gemmatimonadota bacterium]
MHRRQEELPDIWCTDCPIAAASCGCPASSASATRDRCRNGPRMIRRRSSCRRATSTFRVTTPPLLRHQRAQPGHPSP